MELIRLVVIEDHPLMCLGIRHALDASDDIEIVGEARTAREGIELLGRLQPDVALLDYALPDADALVVLAEARKRAWRTRVLVLTCHADEHHVRSSIDGGAIGFLTKTTIDAEFLSRAVRDASQGRSTISPDVMNVLVRAARHPAGDPTRLTDRELDVWYLLATGMTNREIAHALCLSERTVKYHVAHVFQKTGTRSRSEATAFAYRSGHMSDGS